MTDTIRLESRARHLCDRLGRGWARAGEADRRAWRAYAAAESSTHRTDQPGGEPSPEGHNTTEGNQEYRR